MDKFLPITNTFVYYQISNVHKYKGLVLTNKLENQNLFPYPKENIILGSYFMLKNRFFYSNKAKETVFNVLKKTYNPFFFSAYARKFRKIAKDNDVRLIHAHFGPNGAGFTRFKKYLGVPMITSFYGYDIKMAVMENPHLYDELFKTGEGFLVEGNNAKKELVRNGCAEEKIIINHLGINPKDFPYKKRENREKVRILMVARFEEKKGTPYLIKAFDKVHRERPKAELMITGDGSMRREIENLIKELGIPVILTGIKPMDEVKKEIYEADIFAHPSITASNGDTEGGAPTILLNAQASGIPVISTMHADIPEEVINGKSGILVEEKDVEGLAEALLELIDNPKKRESFGKFGRKHVEENYNIIKQGKKLEEIYSRFMI